MPLDIGSIAASQSLSQTGLWIYGNASTRVYASCIFLYAIEYGFVPRSERRPLDGSGVLFGIAAVVGGSSCWALFIRRTEKEIAIISSLVVQVSQNTISNYVETREETDAVKDSLDILAKKAMLVVAEASNMRKTEDDEMKKVQDLLEFL